MTNPTPCQLTNLEDLPELMSENELAGAARRSAAFIRHARMAGLLRPYAKTGRAYLYQFAAVQTVQAIRQPVLTAARLASRSAAHAARYSPPSV